ncbi:MAG: DUF4837 family protein [Bacteroidota bacterium]
MPLRLLLLLTLLVPFVGCGSGEPYVPQARGLVGEVIVVTDSTTWRGPVGEALREELGASVATLNPVGGEPAFGVRQQSLQPQFLNGLKMQRSVVFAAALSDSTNTAQFIRARLGEGTEAAIGEQEPGAGVIAREDLWARGQMIYYATDTTPERLAEAIRSRGEQMRADFDRVALANEGVEMYDRGRQILLEDTLLADHGFAVNVQHDYFVATDSTLTQGFLSDGRFLAGGDQAQLVWLRRTLVEIQRNLLVYYEDGVTAEDAAARLQPGRLVPTLDALTSRFLRGAQNDSAFVFTEPRISVAIDSTTINGNAAFEVRGLWRMNLFVQGGPFIAYTFYEPAQERLYVMYGFVLAPGKEKRRFIRQLEAMARTFRTADATPTVAALHSAHHHSTAHHGSG